MADSRALADCSDAIDVPQRPALGVECDMARIDNAYRLYKCIASGGRDDSIAMQFLIPSWFCRKRGVVGHLLMRRYVIGALRRE